MADTEPGTARLRLMTYNIRQCTVGSSRGEVDRVAEVIADSGADVVALQEVGVRSALAGRVDQPGSLAERLAMRHHFQPSMPLSCGGEFGNAVLSRLPFRVRGSGLLPRLPERPRREPRGASWLELEVGAAARLHLVVTHLGLARRERLAQLDALLGEGWLGDPRCGGHAVLCGDLNFVPGSREHRLLAGRLRDALQVAPPERGHRATFPALRPLVRLDHAFVSAGVRVRRTEIVRRPELRRVSDHLPVLVDLEVPVAGRAAESDAPRGEQVA
jgi:endonuclease/exonuclease/phosphatase family metal-dependent hydrolase